MSFIKKILVVSVIVIIVFQFIRPVHNKSGQVFTIDISKVITIPDTVLTLLKNACFDCHSNNTNYPWYSNVQPMGWLIAKHIGEGKKELNFSEFGSYSKRVQISKLNGIENSIKDDIMPLSSYKLMHKNAQLSTSEKTILNNWVRQSIDNLSAKK